MSCIYVVFSIFIKKRLIVLHSGSSKLLLCGYENSSAIVRLIELDNILLVPPEK